MNERQKAGLHQVLWDSQNNTGELVSSGNYLYRIKTGSFQKIRELVLLR
ncbi:hypothetical protein GWO43_19360 [candidate division KSB1 bacterium]|nr:hypothetical protein [candidate division KSB1 bacterium]NIR70542.1 hypothetical protein [candidate division KSB1 bacterium]NIS26214.1 hypothetical protein [candidate division KSB1 bacterium]NIT72993.1 hypothetical protein [candidate division KSB1 bacterium]NIU26862.1 hypothetical protein [candidate division KSB1 bacterium]